MKSYLLLTLIALSTANLYSMDPEQAAAKMAEITAIMATAKPVVEKIAALSVLKAALPAGAGLQNYFRNHIRGLMAELNPAAHPAEAHPGAAALGQALVFAHPPAFGGDDSDMSDSE